MGKGLWVLSPALIALGWAGWCAWRGHLPSRAKLNAVFSVVLLLYLAGQSLGLGVCGVGAFFDDEAAALAGIDPAGEWVVHLVAVGAIG